MKSNFIFNYALGINSTACADRFKPFMRITSIDIAATQTYGDSLGAIKMERLGKIVAIAGKNGAGKTRLFKRLEVMADNYNSFVQRQESAHQHVQRLEERVAKLQTEVKKKSLRTRSVGFFEVLRREQHELEINKNVLQEKSPVNASGAKRLDLIRLMPQAGELADPYSFSKSGLVEAANIAGFRMVSNLTRASLCKIQHLQNRYMEATHPGNKMSEPERERYIRSYEEMQALLQRFLGTKADRGPEGDAGLFGFRIGQSKLSQGQTILLQFCVAVHASGADIANLIVLIEEPETYLHPSAAIEIIDEISRHVTNGQLWITTHSVPLLAHLETDSIWWMDEGSIKYAGNIPQQVLTGLLGNEERVARLADFLNLPANLAGVRFAYQSLFSPSAVDARPNDPQMRQISEIISAAKTGAKFHLLDFGAGKGRLASTILDADELQTAPPQQWLEYVAFDRDASGAASCKDAIARMYGTSEKRYFNDYSELLATFDEGKFDCVIMCNVLHEIDPIEWLTLFEKYGGVVKLLNKDGFLLVVEDMQIPVGEKPHQRGFLVLDTPQLKELFRLRQDEFTVHTQRNGRLKAHRIPKVALTRITAETRKNALESICSESHRRILELRQVEPTYQNGRLHGFWVQQLANAHLALQQLSG